MKIPVRLGAGLSNLAGRPRLVVELEEAATIADLLANLKAGYPAIAESVDRAVPLISGRAASPTEPLAAGQEVALLLPVAGGSK